MMCYKDMTFCKFYETCKDGGDCCRALTQTVMDAAARRELYISQFADRPDCFVGKEEPREKACCTICWTGIGGNMNITAFEFHGGGWVSTYVEVKMTNCECKNWARDNIVLLTDHHPNCPKYDVEREAKNHIKALVAGILIWANDEDGVHPACYDAFRSACYFMGRPDLVEE